MKRLRLYMKEVMSELLHKVSWPTWEELQGSAVVVMIASLIIALIVWGMDKASATVLSSFYHLFD